MLTFNIQVGIGGHRLRHYLTHSWRHVLPHQKSMDNLDQISHVIRDFDFVALQEVDAGSFRSQFVNQIEYLAMRSHFPYWCYQTNRKLGKLARASNGLLSKLPIEEVESVKLPGRIPGRGALVARVGDEHNALVLVALHLALGKRARMLQLSHLIEIINSHPHVIVMGDFNCQLHSEEMQHLIKHTELHSPHTGEALETFPSWRPKRRIDHILVSPHITINQMDVLPCAQISDHLPISMEITLPKNFFKQSA